MEKHFAFYSGADMLDTLIHNDIARFDTLLDEGKILVPVSDGNVAPDHSSVALDKVEIFPCLICHQSLLRHDNTVGGIEQSHADPSEHSCGQTALRIGELRLDQKCSGPGVDLIVPERDLAGIRIDLAVLGVWMTTSWYSLPSS